MGGGFEGWRRRFRPGWPACVWVAIFGAVLLGLALVRVALTAPGAWR